MQSIMARENPFKKDLWTKMLDIARWVDLDTLALRLCPLISTSLIVLLGTTGLKLIGVGIGLGLR